ncbi:MAG: carboxypeptidase-like regulatory domain-containing protein [Bacteroidales bacterium]|nr:carboxypeptidase-like regulatory domain-containing protein [Bacteroidales bacterium]
MKTSFYKSLILGLSFLSCLALSAQYNKSSYFMKNSTTKQLMNPALNSGRAYLDLPVLGGIDLGLGSNLGVTKFLFPDEENDQLLTFLHPDVSADQFLDGLADNNFFEMNGRFALLGFGANTKHGYLSFNMDIKVGGGFNIPKSFFSFLKKGMDNGTRTTYDIRNLRFYGEGYLETGIGYSIDLLDNLSVGLRLKGLIGLSAINAGIDQMFIDMRPEEWVFNTKASLATNAPVTFKYNQDGYVDNADPTMSKIKDAISLGYGIDLGVAYSPIKDLTLSAAVTDLGGIKWKNMTQLASAGEVRFSGLNNLNFDDDNSDESMEDQFEELADDMKEIIQFSETGQVRDEFHRLNASTVIGAEYTAWKDRVSAGLLFTTDFSRFDNYSEMMFVANLRPIDMLQLSASYTFYSEYAKGLGLSLSLFNTLFVAWERTLLNVTPDYTPIDPLTTSIHFGLHIPLSGTKRVKHSAIHDRSAETLQAAVQAMSKVNISGVVTNVEGEPVKDVNIFAEGYSDFHTMTNADGAYSIEVPKGAKLRFSALTYKPQTLKAKGDKLDVRLKH